MVPPPPAWQQRLGLQKPWKLAGEGERRPVERPGERQSRFTNFASLNCGPAKPHVRLANVTQSIGRQPADRKVVPLWWSRRAQGKSRILGSCSFQTPRSEERPPAYQVFLRPQARLRSSRTAQVAAAVDASL